LSFYDNEKVGGRDAVLLKDERKFYLMRAAMVIKVKVCCLPPSCLVLGNFGLASLSHPCAILSCFFWVEARVPSNRMKAPSVLNELTPIVLELLVE